MRLEFKDAKSNKFWEAKLAGKSFEASWGKIGTAGQKKKQTFATPAAAQKAWDKLVAEKKKKGYREVGKPAPVVPNARDEKLEAAIRARREDQAAYLVYSDFLQSVGDPLGELIAVQVALSKKKDPAQVKRERALIKKLAVLEADMGSLEFRWGLVDSVRLENTRDWMDSNFDIRPVLDKLFGSAACAALRELRIGVIRWDDQEELQKVFEVAGRHAWATGLERLHVGDVHEVDMAHYSIGTVGKVISKTFPALRSLVLHSSEKQWGGARDQSFDFSGLALPELKELVIETCSMSKSRLKALWGAKLPKLEGLTVWFGSDQYGADCTVKDLTPLLEGKVFPHVKHLGLANAEFEAEIAEALPRSKIAGRIESLNLSMGVLDDSHVPALVEAAKAFKKLKSLDVSENWISAAGIATLAKAYPSVDGREQNEPWEDDPDYRYISVSE